MTRAWMLALCLVIACGGCQTDFGAQTSPGENPYAVPEFPTNGDFVGTWRVSGEDEDLGLGFSISCEGTLQGERTGADASVHSFDGDVLGAAIQGSTSDGSDDWTLVGLLHATSDGGAASGFWQGSGAIGVWHVVLESGSAEDCPGS